MIPGPYSLRNYRFRSRAVTTNKCPEGAYRGVGLPVSAFVHERVMDVLAAELGMDRAEMRRRNFVAPADLPYLSVTNQRYDSGDYALALSRALDAIGYGDFPERQSSARRDGKLLGLGIASYVEYAGMGSATFHGRGMVAIAGNDRAWMRVEPDGTIAVWTTLPAIGQGVDTTFAQMTAAALGTEPDAIRVERSDTAAGPGGGTGTFASRSAVAGGGAIAIAGRELRERLLADAAERLEVSPGDLEISGRRVAVKGSPSRGVDLAELAALSPERTRAEASFDPPLPTYPYASHACIVEVDAETGAVQLLSYVVAEDCGTIVNPLIVEGQAHGAVAQGIGGTLYEAIVYDEAGQMTTASLMDYLVPTAMELPYVELDHLEIPAPDSQDGVKGVGEGGTLAPPGAIANAVSNALGVELNELPLTPERVRTAALAANVLRWTK
jgi:carbon-monoxide dehydrogenase large subunit